MIWNNWGGDNNWHHHGENYKIQIKLRIGYKETDYKLHFIISLRIPSNWNEGLGRVSGHWAIWTAEQCLKQEWLATITCEGQDPPRAVAPMIMTMHRSCRILVPIICRINFRQNQIWCRLYVTLIPMDDLLPLYSDMMPWHKQWLL